MLTVAFHFVPRQAARERCRRRWARTNKESDSEFDFEILGEAATHLPNSFTDERIKSAPALMCMRFGFGLMILVLILAGCVSASGGKDAVSAVVSKPHRSQANLPKPPVWNLFRSPHPQDRPILVISWTQHPKFGAQKSTSPKAIGESLTVDQLGNAIWDYHFPFATQGSLVTRFEHPPDPKRILAYLKALPPSAEVLNPADALFVSFEDNGRWSTRVYDWRRAPAALAQMYTFMIANAGRPNSPAPWMTASF
jgi:hypothetical protein